MQFPASIRLFDPRAFAECDSLKAVRFVAESCLLSISNFNGMMSLERVELAAVVGHISGQRMSVVAGCCFPGRLPNARH
jgi:hypothetical protein